MIRNQLGRRNLLPAVRVQLALMLKPILKEKAKANQVSHGGTSPGKKSLPAKVPEVIEVNEVVAKAAGVSRKTVDHFETVMKRGDDVVPKSLFNGLASPCPRVTTTLLPHFSETDEICRESVSGIEKSAKDDKVRFRREITLFCWLFSGAS